MTTKSPYQKPQIIRHMLGVGNRFGPARARRVQGEVEGQPVDDLIKKYGSPLFVFAERDLRFKARAMRKAFDRRWKRMFYGWSYKTNHLDAVCGIFHQEGWGAEVVSNAEYAMARRLGCPGERIIFNGACKPADTLRRAVEDGALIQVDHFAELALLEDVAAAVGKRARVGLRVNMRVDAAGMVWDRFGFHLESGEPQRAARMVVNSKHMTLVGLHCHLGTYVMRTDAYRESARRLGALMLELERALECRLDLINLGGGFPSRNAMHSQYELEYEVPSFEAFAHGIAEELEGAFARRDGELPQLALETGRALVDESGTLLSTVMGTRRLAGGMSRGLILDAGVNLLYTATWYRHDVQTTSRVTGQLEDTTLYGPLCMAIDCIRRNVLLPPLEAGHTIAIWPVGAYNVTQWMQFSQMRPACVMVMEDGSVEVIRRAETIDDLKNVERMPEKLRPSW